MSSRRRFGLCSRAAVLCLFLLLPLALPGFLSGSSSEFAAIAEQIADAILHASKGSAEKPFVLVDGFGEVSGKDTDLSAELTSDFTEALRANRKRWQILSADEPGAFFKGPSKDWCPVGDQASFVVDGSSDETGGQIDLHFIVKQTVNKRDGDQRSIFDEHLRLPLNSERQNLASRMFGATAGGGSDSHFGWESSGFRAPENIADILNFDLRTTDPKKNPYTMPKCLSCKPAPFTDPALRAGMAGTAKLKVLVDANGDPERIVVLSGLPCGLTQAALTAVSQWKLAAARDENKKPIPMWVLSQQSFHLN